MTACRPKTVKTEKKCQICNFLIVPELIMCDELFHQENQPNLSLKIRFLLLFIYFFYHDHLCKNSPKTNHLQQIQFPRNDSTVTNRETFREFSG